MELERRAPPVRDQVVHSRDAEDVGDLVRVGHGGDGAVNDGKPGKLRRHHHRAFNVNVGINETRHQIPISLLDRVNSRNSPVNNSYLLRGNLPREHFNNIGGNRERHTHRGNLEGQYAFVSTFIGFRAGIASRLLLVGFLLPDPSSHRLTLGTFDLALCPRGRFGE